MTSARLASAAFAIMAAAALCGCATTSHRAQTAYFLSERPDGAGVTLFAVELEGDIPGTTSGAGAFPIASGLIATETSAKANPAPERRTVAVAVEEGKVGLLPMDESDMLLVLVNDIGRLGREANLFARLAGGARPPSSDGGGGGGVASGDVATDALRDEALLAGLKRRLQLERDLATAKRQVAADEKRIMLARVRGAMVEKLFDESVSALERADPTDATMREARREASGQALEIESQRKAVAAIEAEAAEPVNRVEELSNALREDGSIEVLRRALGMASSATTNAETGE